MKKTIFVLTVAILFLGAITAICDENDPFERLSEFSIKGSDNVAAIERFHDKESGIEFLCVTGTTGAVRSSSPLSCFPTGRKW